MSKDPPPALTLRWCPKCGQTSETQMGLPNAHNPCWPDASPVVCEGPVQTLTYSLDQTHRSTRKRACIRPVQVVRLYGMSTNMVLGRVRQGFTYAGSNELTAMECPVCGVMYAIPTVLRDNAERIGNRQITWYCPNGHNLGYSGASEAEKARDNAQEALARARQQATAERDLREHTERQLRAQKGETTKAKKRAAAAVCPVDGCGRSFVQLRRHMAAKHPDYKPST